MIRVPFNRPVRLPEHDSVFSDRRIKGCIAGNGEFTQQCESELEALAGTPIRLVTSATHAMEMMALLLEIAPGDEVIVPSFTFVSTANAFALRGATIRFADNDVFGNILPSEVERLANSKTKAVIAVHYAGNSADMDQLVAVCKGKKILLLEDAAQSIGAKYKGRPLGAIGALGCFSFHETKNITSGEGGALIFGDRNFLDRAEVLREKGTNRRQFLQGFTDKYTWVDTGSSYVLSELCAAYLYPQIGRLAEINEKRARLWKRYESELGHIISARGVTALGVPAHNDSNYHLYALVFPGQVLRDRFIASMRESSILCPFHYVSLHTSPMGLKMSGGKPDVLPGSERLSQCLVRLPLYFNMAESEQEYVLEKVADWFRKA